MADAQSPIDFVNHLLSGGGGAGGGIAATLVYQKLFGKNGTTCPAQPGLDKMEAKLDKICNNMEQMVEAQQTGNMLLSEIKGGLSAK